MIMFVREIVGGKSGISTFTGIYVAILVGDGILVHDTAKEGLHVAYNILDLVSTML